MALLRSNTSVKNIKYWIIKKKWEYWILKLCGRTTEIVYKVRHSTYLHSTLTSHKILSSKFNWSWTPIREPEWSPEKMNMPPLTTLFKKTTPNFYNFLKILLSIIFVIYVRDLRMWLEITNIIYIHKFKSVQPKIPLAHFLLSTIKITYSKHLHHLTLLIRCCRRLNCHILAKP